MLKAGQVKIFKRATAIRSFSSAIPTVPNFINGVFEESKTTQWIDVINPATQEVVCRVPQSTKEELQRAEAGAKEAFKTWKEVPVQQRQVIILKYQCLIFFTYF
jgi:malonate-semialdehyde dehydrogenase (acetylating)/methylmalonate-semialdehyde dehydrogenase